MGPSFCVQFCARKSRVQFAVLACVLVASPVLAAAPVAFDVQPVVACHDVSTPDGIPREGTERLVEANFEISALMHDRSRVIEYFYRVDFHDSIKVVDYAPRTQLESRYAEKIAVEDKNEKSKSLGISINGDVATFAHGSAGADVGTKKHKIVRYALKPPMEAVTASGTLNRGHSVYFKLRSTPQHSLEGGKRFSVVLRVPADWQADYVRLRCEARCQNKSYSGTKPQASLCAGQMFLVALHEAGNTHAKRAAERLSSAEQQLRTASITNSKQLKKRAYPSVVHRLGAAIDMYEPRIPPNWLQLVVAGRVGPRHGMVKMFPAEVRGAANEFWESQSDVIRLRES